MYICIKTSQDSHFRVSITLNLKVKNKKNALKHREIVWLEDMKREVPDGGHS